MTPGGRASVINKQKSRAPCHDRWLVNWIQKWLCSSGLWRTYLAGDLLPWALSGVTLGGDVLEIGPGPGAATDVLLPRVAHLSCVEIDTRLAGRLKERLAGRNVTILCGDGTALPWPAESFDTAICLMMLHHVAPMASQDQLFAEAARVLRPGGTFILLDSRPSLPLSAIHIGDTMLLSDPATIGARLTRQGFDEVAVDVRRHAFRAHARRSAVRPGDASA